MDATNEVRVSFWRRPVDRSFLAWSLVLFLGAHLLIWAALALAKGISFSAMMLNWDAEWYSHIAENGYGIKRNAWAFFPLFPRLVGLLWRALGTAVPSQYVGSVLATGFFGIVAWLFFGSRFRERVRAAGVEYLFTPQTRLGWVFFLFSPASFVFHSNHTESLFLLLSLLSLRAVFLDHWLLAALWAGLASMTRIPGVFLAVSVALIAATRPGLARPARALRFAAIGAVSAVLFSLHMIYMAKTTGDPFTLFKVQEQWSINGPLSVMRTLRTFWFGNPSQYLGFNSLLHYPYALFMLVGVYLVWIRNWALATYGLMCIGIMFIQGDLTNAYRFTAVLFPFLFVLGDWMARMRERRAWVLVAVWGALNAMVAAKYGLNTWAY